MTHHAMPQDLRHCSVGLAPGCGECSERGYGQDAAPFFPTRPVQAAAARRAAYATPRTWYSPTTAMSTLTSVKTA